MRDIYFGDFRSYVVEQMRALAAQDHEYQSIEWFLLRYLKRIEKATTAPTTPGRVEGSMRGFIRFYVDNIDEKSEVADMCLKIYEAYRKTLREQQEKKANG
jgi:hypothetical protein